ncbi:MAG: hypothetical protein AB8I08_13455 [Sandaracinaceae bacterium]
MRLPLVLLVFLVGGCDDGPEPVACRFGPSHLVGTTRSPAFDDLRLVDEQEGLSLYWSDAAGLHRRGLSADGAPRNDAVRIGARCEGGFDVLAEPAGSTLACLQRGDPDRGRAGQISVRSPDGATQHTGPVGVESRGVQLVRDADGLRVGWRDADGFVSVARESVSEGGTLSTEGRILSSHGTFASAPQYLARDGSLLRAWTESWLEDGQATGHLFVQRDERPPRPSLDVGDLDVRIHLDADPRGPLVSLRDSRPRGARHRLFVGRPDENLAVHLSDVRSPSRADADGAAPFVPPCGDHVFALSTRRSSRGVTMVTVERLDPETLRSAEAEHQIYEYHARFPQVVAACVDGTLLLAVGERATEVSPRPRLRTYTLRCAPGLEHQRTPRIDGREHDLVD